MSKKRLAKSICCLLLCAVLLVPLLRYVSADNTREMRETLIYEFLRDEMGFGTNAEAIACGILANINAEVGGSAHNYDPTLYVNDSNGIYSYGICMWNGRRDEIINYIYQSDTQAKITGYCARKGYTQDDQYLLVGQLYFLKHDLYESGNFNDTMSRILAVENTPEGAYYVGFTFCFWYERPATQSASGYKRGINARDTFWPKYVGTAETITTANTTLTVSDAVYPAGFYGALPSFVLRGTVNSNKPILNVTATAYDAAGNVGTTYTRDWYYRTYNMKWDGMDSNIKFGKLANGSYHYIVTATDYDNKVHTVVDAVFHIGCKTSCIVTYDTDGASALSAVGANFGDSITLPAAPTKTGYIFAGWSDGTAVYQAGDSYRVLNSKVTLTALWTACEHQYDEGTVTAEPTCTADGVMTYTCTVCGETKTEPIPAAGHRFGEDWHYDTANHWQVCTCGETGTPESHSFTDTVTPATPEAQGYTTHTCTVCAYSYQDSYTDYSGIPVEEPFAPGDVNGDGYLDGDDLTLLNRYLTGGTGLSDEAMAAANVDGDEAVNAADAVALARLLLAGTPESEE